MEAWQQARLAWTEPLMGARQRTLLDRLQALMETRLHQPLSWMEVPRLRLPSDITVGAQSRRQTGLLAPSQEHPGVLIRLSRTFLRSSPPSSTATYE